MSPNLTLNPTERPVTMTNEFCNLNYLYKVVLRLPLG